MFLGNEKNKNIILTYQLEQAQLDILYQLLKGLNFCGKLAVVKDLDQVFFVPHLMAFLNFASLDEEQEQAFFAKLKTKVQKRLSEPHSKRKMPLTYILHCKTVTEKRANLFLSEDNFADKERLRLILLQKVKEMEGKKPKEPVSDRLIRLLEMYHTIRYYGSLTPRYEISSRRFYQDMAIIKMLVPDIRYDKEQKKYTATYLPDKEESRKVVAEANIPARIKRVLLIYQQLLYEGWITKEVAGQICGQVSLRMFQRDLVVIDELYNGCHRVVYDMEQQKYILNDGKTEVSGRIRKRNLHLI